MSQQQLVQKKTFEPEVRLMDLAYIIRNLKSEQTKGLFVDPYDSNKKCIMGALATEFLGSDESFNCIVRKVQNHWIGNFGSYTFEYYDSKTMTNKTVTRKLHGKLVIMNDTGRTFNEIADWVELEAYRLGEWK